MSGRDAPRADQAPPLRPSAGRRGRGHRRWLGHALSVVTVAAMLVSFLLAFAAAGHGPLPAAAARTSSPPAMLPQARVTITARAGMMSVPRSYLGLSTEYWDLPRFERRVAVLERVLSLLHPRGEGPLILRIGGDSADHTFWSPGAGKMPRWAFRVTPAWLRRTSSLVRRARLRLIVDLNLVTGSASTAALWARAAQKDLPPRSIVGFEIGNESDIYSRSYWRAAISRTGRASALLPNELSASSYTQDFQSYARAIAPSVPLLGPALANPERDVSWISSLIAGTCTGLGIVTAHRYPYSACVDRRSRTYPTISRLLSEQATAGLAPGVRAAVGLAHRAGLPFRLTELNSVTCGGRSGVSDTFATALWAPDALFELLRAGVDGVNVHVRARAINAAFAVNGHGLTARPLLYGLVLFARTLGPQAQLVHLRLHARRWLHLKVWAVRVSGDVLHVLVINKSDHAAGVDLRLPATRPATVERLLAASARSRAGVTLGGQQLAHDGRWHGQLVSQTLTRGARGYELKIRGVSAALLTVHVRPLALATHPGMRNARVRQAARRGPTAAPG